MRITTKAVFNMNRFDSETGRMELLEWQGFEYSGPVDRLGGGPSIEQRNAAAAQASLSQQEADIGKQRLAREQSQYDLVKPYYTDLLNNGLPYKNLVLDAQSGINARAFQPARSALNKRFASDGLPGGARDAAFSRLDAEQARAYDDLMMNFLSQNEGARSAGAAGLVGQQQIANPFQWYGGASSGYNSIMQAPLQSAGIGGVLGGVVGSLGSAAIGKIPFGGSKG